MSQMYAMMLPILPGKLEDWKTFAARLLKEQRREYEAARQRAGVLREMVWHQATPLGDMMILVLELEGQPEDFLKLLMHPDSDFGREFLVQAKAIHGLDPETMEQIQPNPLIFDWASPSLLEKAGETALGIGQNLAGTAQSLLGKAGTTATEVGQNMASNATNLAGRAQGMAQEAGSRLQQQAFDGARQFQQQANETGERIQQQAQEVRKQMETRTAELLDKAGDSVAEATRQMQHRAGEALESAAEVGQDIAEKATGLFHQALDLLHKKPEKPSDTDSAK